MIAVDERSVVGSTWNINVRETRSTTNGHENTKTLIFAKKVLERMYGPKTARTNEKVKEVEFDIENTCLTRKMLVYVSTRVLSEKSHNRESKRKILG